MGEHIRVVGWPSFAAAAFCLFAAPAVGFDGRPESVSVEAVEQLDPVEVTAERIIPPKRPLPLPLPEVSTATPLPPDSIGVGLESEGRTPIVPQSPRLLRDDTATKMGERTRVRYLDPVRPPYPQRAREMGWQGTVVLRVAVKADGTVGELAVRRTSGHATLDEAALTAVKGWRFVPPMDGEFTMPAMVDVPVRFDLKEQREHPGDAPGS